jgi:hypothetical protein
MHKSNHHAVRMLLQKYSDGLTVYDIAERVEKSTTSSRRALLGMPDAYIDRWTAHRKQWVAVWCVVEVPEDCPRPERKERVRPTQFRRMEPRKLSQVLHGFVHQNANSAGSY